MIAYTIKRILSVIPVMLGITVTAFALGLWSPGDPAQLALSQDGVSEVTFELLEQKRQALGLDQTPIHQYLNWMVRALHGNLGTSYLTGKSVSGELFRRLPITLELTACSALLACVFGILGGTLASMCHGSWGDKLVVQLSNLLLSFPSFWLGILLIIVFAEYCKLLPTSGTGGISHMILPSATLAAATAATTVRLTRSSMLEQLGKPYMIAATAKGLSRVRLYVTHALPNAVLPVVTLICTYIGGILGGSVVIENIFALPGIGDYALTAIHARDYPAIQGYVLFAGGVFVLASLAGDLICAAMNPKMRLGRKKR